MVLKSLLATGICVAWLGSVSPSMAAGYQAGDLLGLDLNKAALSPIPLGPPAQLEPVPVEAKSSPDIKVTGEQAVKRRDVVRTKPLIGRAKVARRHTNPLDAEAFDTRIQVWPCRSGGICNWQRTMSGH
jgi:hypothetical protein